MTPLASLAVEPVMLRRASPEDCQAVWRWNFSPDVRARSKQRAAVAFADHARWFADRLGPRHAPIWVIEEYGLPVGVVRLDAEPTGLTRISIALAASARGRGVGKAALTAACRAWAEPVFAEILADNRASRRCFEACGFHSVVECDGLLTYHWDPET
jgi:RimJ/RimL family protein N-acetyltransferase